MVRVHFTKNLAHHVACPAVTVVGPSVRAAIDQAFAQNPAVRDIKRVAVDGRLVVTRTRDGGRSFEAIGTGLPRRDCYDLVYRHGLDVDADGELLAMGSTMGNLWVGERQGSRWSGVSGNLPPIAAVAWG